MENPSNITQSILVVEDETFIRLCAVLDLKDAGYVVFDAADAQEALRVFGEHPEITTLFTDINMPGAVDGLALAHLIAGLNSGVQLIITSGRTEPTRRNMPAGACFLCKPYTSSAVSALIRNGGRAEVACLWGGPTPWPGA